jgi:hypothetical protein
VRLDRRQRSPGLHLGVNGRHLLISRVQLLLVRLRLLLRLVPRERLLLCRAVLLYLEHKVNIYSPIEKVIFRIRSKLKQESLPLALSHSLSFSLSPENPYLGRQKEQMDNVREQRVSKKQSSTYV